MITTNIDYATRLENITGDNKMINPSTEDKISINANSRQIFIPESLRYIGVKGDTKAETVYLTINRYFDGADLSQKQCAIYYINAQKQEYKYQVDQAYIEKNIDGEDLLVFGWEITKEVTKKAGPIVFAVSFYDMGVDNITGMYTEVYSFNTQAATIYINDNLARPESSGGSTGGDNSGDNGDTEGGITSGGGGGASSAEVQALSALVSQLTDSMDSLRRNAYFYRGELVSDNGVIDLDRLDYPGVYYRGVNTTSIINVPTNEYGFVEYSGPGIAGFQRYTTANEGKTYTRTKNSGDAWSEWSLRLADQAIDLAQDAKFKVDDFVNSIVVVSEDKPDSLNNKLWVKPKPASEEGTFVPTWAEHQELANRINLTESAIDAIEEALENIEEFWRGGSLTECVTPEMYGAKGDGLIDDSAAFIEAINSGKPVIGDLSKIYNISAIVVENVDIYIKDCSFYVPPKERRGWAFYAKNCQTAIFSNCTFRSSHMMPAVGYDSDSATSRYVHKDSTISNVDFIHLREGIKYAVIDNCKFFNGIFCVNPRNSAYTDLSGDVLIQNCYFDNFAIAAEPQYMANCTFSNNYCKQGDFAAKLSHIVYLSNTLPGTHGLIKNCELIGCSNNIIQCYHSHHYMLEVQNSIIRGRVFVEPPDVLGVMTNASEGSTTYMTGCLIDAPEFTLTGRPNDSINPAQFIFDDCVMNVACATHTGAFNKNSLYTFNNCTMTITQKGFYGDGISIVGGDVVFKGDDLRLVSAENFRATGCKFTSYAEQNLDVLIAMYEDCAITACSFESLSDVPRKLFVGYGYDNFVCNCTFKGFEQASSYTRVSLSDCNFIDNYHLCNVNIIDDGNGIAQFTTIKGNPINSGDDVRNKMKITMEGIAKTGYEFSRWLCGDKSFRQNPNVFTIREDTDFYLFHKYVSTDKVIDAGIASWTNGVDGVHPFVTLNKAGKYQLIGRNIMKFISAAKDRYTAQLTNNVGTTISQTSPDGTITVTQNQSPDSWIYSAYNGQVNLFFQRAPVFADKIIISMKIEVLTNPLNATDWRLYTIDEYNVDQRHFCEITDDGRIVFEILPEEMGGQENAPFCSLRLGGRSIRITELQAEFETLSDYEPTYNGGTITKDEDGVQRFRTLVEKDGFNQIIQMDDTKGIIEIDIFGPQDEENWDLAEVGAAVWLDGNQNQAAKVQVDQDGTYHLTGKNVVRRVTTDKGGFTAAKNSYGTTLSTAMPNGEIVVTQENYSNADVDSYANGQFHIVAYTVPVNGNITLSFDVEVTNNPLNYQDRIKFYGIKNHGADIVNGHVSITIPSTSFQDVVSFEYRKSISMRLNGRSMIIRNLQIEYGNEESAYEAPVEITELHLTADETTEITQRDGYNAIVQIDGTEALINVKYK